MTQPTAVIVALGVVLALAVLVMLVWRGRVRRLNGKRAEARFRRDIRALRRVRPTRATGLRADDVWSAGADSAPASSRSKKAAAWVALGSLGSCGGCGGCGCGG